MLFDDPNKVGVANLVSDLLMEGTKNKTPIELEEAIDELGARINMYSTKEEIVLQGNCLSSKINDVYALVEEILLEPRWDEKEFARVKDETVEAINRNSFNPTRIASQVFDKLIYGEDNILSNSSLGTRESVKSITIDDLKNYYAKYFSPSLAYISVVGNISKDDAVSLFKSLESKWEAKDIELPELKFPEGPSKSVLCFVDFPNAKQSQIRAGNLSLSYSDPDYYKAVVMNYKLGGSFSGLLNLILREEKGFTYGARSGFSGSVYPGEFTASSAVMSSATLESVEIVKDEIGKYRGGISNEDLEFTKNALVKSNARRFETLGALLGMVNDIAKYNFPVDFIKNQEYEARNMTLEEHKQLAEKYLHPDKMYYLVVGDAATQFQPLRKLGFDEVVLMDKEGNVVKKY